MPSDDPLEGLRALHLPPETTSLWSDLGFAAALGLALALAGVFVVRALWRPKRSLRESALDAFEETKSLPTGERRAAQAAILRRVVRTVDGEEAARSSGDAWAAALDRTLRTDFFTARAGRVFATGLYSKPKAADDDDALDGELGALLKKLGR